jgi:hypothetical protein
MATWSVPSSMSEVICLAGTTGANGRATRKAAQGAVRMLAGHQAARSRLSVSDFWNSLSRNARFSAARNPNEAIIRKTTPKDWWQRSLVGFSSLRRGSFLAATQVLGSSCQGTQLER